MVELAYALTATDDDRLEQAEALVRAYCGWHISPSRTETVTLPGPGGQLLVLPSLNLTGVTSVTSDGIAADATTYNVSKAGVLTHQGYWGTRPIVVVFTHGYDVPPPEVTAVVQAIAQRAIDNGSSLPLVRKTRGPFTDQYGDAGSSGLLSFEMSALARYKIVDVF